MLVVAKPVTWTLDPIWPRKTGSRHNDVLSCVGKPKGSITMSKYNYLIPLFTKRFSVETALESFHPAGIRVKLVDGDSRATKNDNRLFLCC